MSWSDRDIDEFYSTHKYKFKTIFFCCICGEDITKENEYITVFGDIVCKICIDENTYTA